MSGDFVAARRGSPGRSAAAALVLISMLLLSAGCTEFKEPAKQHYQPSSSESVAGQKVKRVKFTAEGAHRVQLQTTTARKAGGQTVIDYAALIYDGQGLTWVYTAPEPLTFIRAQVVVDRVVADDVFLRSGISAGTRVVTVGATQVYGAELNIGGKH